MAQKCGHVFFPPSSLNNAAYLDTMMKLSASGATISSILSLESSPRAPSRRMALTRPIHSLYLSLIIFHIKYERWLEMSQWHVNNKTLINETPSPVPVGSYFSYEPTGSSRNMRPQCVVALMVMKIAPRFETDSFIRISVSGPNFG